MACFAFLIRFGSGVGVGGGLVGCIFCGVVVCSYCEIVAMELTGQSHQRLMWFLPFVAVLLHYPC